MEKIKFKFRLYPELEEAHIKYKLIEGESYSAELAYEDTGDEQFNILWGQKIKEEEDYCMHVYSPLIFKVFSSLKPKLITNNGKSLAWNDIFAENYDEIDESNKSKLVELIEEGGLTRLEPSYYEFIEIDSHGQEIKTLHKKVKEKHLVTKCQI